MWCGRPGRLGPGRSVGAFLEGVLAELHGRTVMQGRVRSKAGPGLQPVKSSVPSSAAGDRRHNASARLADLTAQGEAPPISFLLRWCAGAQHRQKQQHRPQQQRAGEGLVCAISASAMVFIPHQSHSHRDWRAGPPPGPSRGCSHARHCHLAHDGKHADAAARMGTHRRRQASHGVHDSVQAVQNPEQPNQGPSSAVGGQPRGQVGRALKVEQGVG